MCLPFFRRPKEKREITLVLIGLDNAGKTTLFHVLQGNEDSCEITPTCGFSTTTIRIRKRSREHITLFDVGGGKGIRGIWVHYLSQVHGAVFMVDASDCARFEEAKDVLHDIHAHPCLRGKPLLILANKQDERNAVSAEVIREALDVDKIMLDGECYVQAVMTTRKDPENKQKKRPRDRVWKGVNWILNTIRNRYETLALRVETETEESEQQRRKEREEKEDRVRRDREERLKKEIALKESADAEALAVIVGELPEPPATDIEEPDGPLPPDPFRRPVIEISKSTDDSALPPGTVDSDADDTILRCVSVDTLKRPRNGSLPPLSRDGSAAAETDIRSSRSLFSGVLPPLGVEAEEKGMTAPSV